MCLCSFLDFVYPDDFDDIEIEVERVEPQVNRRENDANELSYIEYMLRYHPYRLCIQMGLCASFLLVHAVELIRRR